METDRDCRVEMDRDSVDMGRGRGTVASLPAPSSLAVDTMVPLGHPHRFHSAVAHFLFDQLMTDSMRCLGMETDRDCRVEMDRDMVGRGRGRGRGIVASLPAPFSAAPSLVVDTMVSLGHPHRFHSAVAHFLFDQLMTDSMRCLGMETDRDCRVEMDRDMVGRGRGRGIVASLPAPFSAAPSLVVDTMVSLGHPHRFHSAVAHFLFDQLMTDSMRCLGMETDRDCRVEMDRDMVGRGRGRGIVASLPAPFSAAPSLVVDTMVSLGHPHRFHSAVAHFLFDQLMTDSMRCLGMETDRDCRVEMVGRGTVASLPAPFSAAPSLAVDAMVHC